MFAILRYKQTQSTDQSHNFDFNMAKNNLKRATAGQYVEKWTICVENVWLQHEK